MPLHIQDPANKGTRYLLEELVGAATTAVRGGGAFAFASAAGANLLLGDKDFATFAKHKAFRLVVGMDAITNVKSIQALEDAKTKLPGLKVNAFLHNHKGRLFHPKFCWFRNKNGGILFAGSGNLTGGGLVRNWEAFSSTKLSKSEINTIEVQWQEWLLKSHHSLCELNDPKIIAEAKKNIVVSKKIAKVTVQQGKPEELLSDEKEEQFVIPAPTDVVLVAEIPKSSDRWKQANFHKQTFETFFEAKPSSSERIFLYHVKDDGTLAAPESRPSVTVASHNYRFELGAANGLKYPAQGRPIAVFVRMAPRVFRYRLLMTNTSGYGTVRQFLEASTAPVGNRVRDLVITLDALKAAWPNAPF